MFLSSVFVSSRPLISQNAETGPEIRDKIEQMKSAKEIWKYVKSKAETGSFKENYDWLKEIEGWELIHSDFNTALSGVNTTSVDEADRKTLLKKLGKMDTFPELCLLLARAWQNLDNQKKSVKWYSRVPYKSFLKEEYSSLIRPTKTEKYEPILRKHPEVVECMSYVKGILHTIALQGKEGNHNNVLKMTDTFISRLEPGSSPHVHLVDPPFPNLSYIISVLKNNGKADRARSLLKQLGPRISKFLSVQKMQTTAKDLFGETPNQLYPLLRHFSSWKDVSSMIDPEQVIQEVNKRIQTGTVERRDFRFASLLLELEEEKRAPLLSSIQSILAKGTDRYSEQSQARECFGDVCYLTGDYKKAFHVYQNIVQSRYANYKPDDMWEGSIADYAEKFYFRRKSKSKFNIKFSEGESELIYKLNRPHDFSFRYHPFAKLAFASKQANRRTEALQTLEKAQNELRTFRYDGTGSGWYRQDQVAFYVYIIERALEEHWLAVAYGLFHADKRVRKIRVLMAQQSDLIEFAGITHQFYLRRRGKPLRRRIWIKTILEKLTGEDGSSLNEKLTDGEFSKVRKKHTVTYLKHLLRKINQKGKLLGPERIQQLAEKMSNKQEKTLNIQSLIDQLGDQRLTKRKQATSKLLEKGPRILPALLKNQSTDNPERRVRIERLIRKITLKYYHNHFYSDLK